MDSELKEKSLEFTILEVIEGRRNDWKARVLRVFLFLLSLLFRGLVQLRLFLYRKQILQEHRLGTMVISIGNLSVGGTGKTPIVELFAKTLARRGRRVAILSRGYKSRAQSATENNQDSQSKQEASNSVQPRVVSDGEKIQLEVEQSGDEPWMLAKNLLPESVAVVVDRNRVQCGAHAIEHLNTDTLILDDGLQYLKLRHRLDIVLVDSTQPFSNGHSLPRGTLREPPENLKRASYIFLTKCDGSSTAALHQQIRRYNEHAPIIDCTHKPQHLVELATGEVYPLSYLEGKLVSAISGIARPESFENALEALGAEIGMRARFGDHHFFKPGELEKCFDRAVHLDTEAIITTEKDAVRFPEVIETDLPLFYLRIEIEILAGHEHWEECVKRICEEMPELPARDFK